MCVHFNLIYGKSEKLFLLLSSLFSTILSRACVPEYIYTGVNIPIPNRPENYRPITLSSIYSKLIESIIIADIDDNLNDYQFGFRSGRSTAQACNTYFHWVIALTILCNILKYKIVQFIYMCALDADCFFDSINHISLLYELINVLQANHWLLIHKWYSGLRGVVRWDSNYSGPFRISRGTRQGSLLSPYLFNVFINGLDNDLEQCNHGIAIGDFKYNNVTYADDITLVSSTITGLQVLIDTCVNYSTKWHFKFNAAKSKCMTIGMKYFNEDHTWHLGPNIQLVNGNSLDILGVSYNAYMYGTNTDHVTNRISKCRQSVYGLRDSSTCMSYPGADIRIKKHLWKTICLPTLLYGMECVPLPNSTLSRLETVQGNHIKQSLGLSKTARTSYLLESLNIPHVGEGAHAHSVLSNKSASFYHSVFKYDTPATELNTILLSRYISTGEHINGTLIDKIVKSGLSPVSAAFNGSSASNVNVNSTKTCGIIDSLQNLLYHQNFMKPYSDEHYFVHLLTKTF